MRIAVLRGGRSAEREVSLRSGAQVAKALRARGHDVAEVDLDADTWDALRDGGFECVFNALHGRLGEDGTVQGMLELLGLPYTGSGVLASALCMDKSRAGRMLAAIGLHVPEFEELEIKQGVAADVVERLVGRYGLPLVVKPVREGSTIGLTIAKDVDAVASGLVLAARCDRRVLVQVRMNLQEAIFVVRDGGNGFLEANQVPAAAPGALEAKGGRGLVLMRAFMDQVKFNDQGNEVTLVMRREAAV